MTVMEFVPDKDVWISSSRMVCPGIHQEGQVVYFAYEHIEMLKEYVKAVEDAHKYEESLKEVGNVS